MRRALLSSLLLVSFLLLLLLLRITKKGRKKTKFEKTSQIKIQNKVELEKKIQSPFFSLHPSSSFLLLSTRKTLFERENAFVVPVATALQTPSPVRIARTPIKKCERKHGVEKDGVRVVEKC